MSTNSPAPGLSICAKPRRRRRVVVGCRETFNRTVSLHRRLIIFYLIKFHLVIITRRARTITERVDLRRGTRLKCLRSTHATGENLFLVCSRGRDTTRHVLRPFIFYPDWWISTGKQSWVLPRFKCAFIIRRRVVSLRLIGHNCYARRPKFVAASLAGK